VNAEGRRAGSDFVVDFGAGVTVELVDAVVDLDEFGDVIGIEILGLVATHPGLCSLDHGPSGPRVSVDADADAVYVRFNDGRSLDQVVRTTTVAFDDADRIVAARVRLEE